MKKLILGMVIATISIGAQAGRFDIDVNINANDRLKNCRENVRTLKDENVTLKSILSTTESRLSQCQVDLRNQGNNGEVRRLQQDLNQANQAITRLENTVDNKNAKIQDLKREIQELQDQLNPRTPRFDLADSIRACGLIKNSSYSSYCAANARKYQVRAKVIENCAKINNAYYASECVEDAGEFNANARQVEECAKISNTSYAGQCVVSAGKGKVPADVIAACRATSSNSYYQAQCVADSGIQ
ncbi:hypothetical protein [Halobacteriovorax sp. JY17]|uniref:hypothetical protein n=1 Tax=Halobacteriovorax sp. JY17 TaxID=2014617 RepID=UPI000C475555|nr:hypothetical protein [Halobacteriovorax sp. JY17]PIK15955.1 MAG: hypothetical protein CES88_04295 [Halobacteriovorax sp. JY17]